MKTIIGFCLGLLVTSLIAGPQESAKTDGYWWKKMDVVGDTESRAFQMGIVSGFGIAAAWTKHFSETQASESLATNLKNYFDLPHLSFDDCIKGINEFYGDYANKNLNIFFAFQYLRLRTGGMPDETLKVKYILYWREHFSK